MRTYTGSLFSLVIIAATFLFATLKLQNMFMRKSPEIQNFTDTGFISSDDVYDPSEEVNF